METIIYKTWNITNAYNEEGVEYWVVWTPNMLDAVSEDFKTIKDAKIWIDKKQLTTGGSIMTKKQYKEYQKYYLKNFKWKMNETFKEFKQRMKEVQ